MTGVFCVVGILLVFAAGCSRHDSDTKTFKSKTDELAASDAETQQLKQQLHDQRIAYEKQTLELTEAMKKYNDAKNTTAGPTDADRQALASAKVSFDEQQKSLEAKLDALAGKLKEFAEKANEKPSVASITPEELKDMMARLGGPGSPATTGPATPPPTPQSASQDTDSTSDESTQAVKTMLAAAGAILCIAEPELAPFVGMLSGVLDIGGDTKDQVTALAGVVDMAVGNPLSPDETNSLKQLINSDNLPKLSPELLVMLEKVSANSPDVGQAVKDALKTITDQCPDGVALIDKIKTMSAKDAATFVASQLGGHYPTKAFKAAVLISAQQANLPDDVIEALSEIPL
jgi:hypothetical protein